MFIPTLVCVALAAASAVPALGMHTDAAGFMRRADIDDALYARTDSHKGYWDKPSVNRPGLSRPLPNWWPKEPSSAPKYNTAYRSDLKHPRPVRPNPKWVGHQRREYDAGLWEREDEELWARMEVDELD